MTTHGFLLQKSIPNKTIFHHYRLFIIIKGLGKRDTNIHTHTHKHTRMYSIAENPYVHPQHLNNVQKQGLCQRGWGRKALEGLVINARVCPVTEDLTAIAIGPLVSLTAVVGGVW